MIGRSAQKTAEINTTANPMNAMRFSKLILFGEVGVAISAVLVGTSETRPDCISPFREKEPLTSLDTVARTLPCLVCSHPFPLELTPMHTPRGPATHTAGSRQSAEL